MRTPFGFCQKLKKDHYNTRKIGVSQSSRELRWILMTVLGSPVHIYIYIFVGVLVIQMLFIFLPTKYLLRYKFRWLLTFKLHLIFINIDRACPIIQLVCVLSRGYGHFLHPLCVRISDTTYNIIMSNATISRDLHVLSRHSIDDIDVQIFTV